MKTIIFTLICLVSLHGYSQSIANLKTNNAVSVNPIKIQFDVIKDDTVSMNFYNRWGQLILNVLPKDLYKAGTYKLEYTLADSMKTDTYIYQLKSSDKTLNGMTTFIDFKGTSKSTDYLKLTYIDSVKITVFDTTKILIIDTLNCIKTTSKLTDAESMPRIEDIIFHNTVPIPYTDVDKLVIFDISGKYIRTISISVNEIQLQDLLNGSYIGLFYKNGDIVKTVKMIKE